MRSPCLPRHPSSFVHGHCKHFRAYTSALSQAPFSRSWSSSPRRNTAQRLPLLELDSAVIPGLLDSDGKEKSLSWTIRDAGADEAWAITGPAAEKGGAVKAHIVKILLGKVRPSQKQRASQDLSRHPFPHQFLKNGKSELASAIQLVSFSARLSSVSASSNNFIDFSARYGAIREEDRVTTYESIMQAMGTATGLVAKMELRPDPLADPVVEAEEDYKNNVRRIEWASREVETGVRELAKRNHAKVLELAPLLNLSHGDPPLLQRPLIALSNGQTRRARILSALCVGSELLVLEEPFTGLDPPTRSALSQLLRKLHSERTPRVVCVLREQDELPKFVTHLLGIGENGQLLFRGPVDGDFKTAADLLAAQGVSHSSQTSPLRGGYESVKRQAEAGVGRGDEAQTPVVEFKDVSIAYKGKKVLDSVSLVLPPGSRTILVGPNGSGKTTMLSLLLGIHPQSYAFGAESLTLFGKARSDPPNAMPLLLRKSGQISPELVNAFPRRLPERGGMTVAQAVGSGFEGIFTKRPLSEAQMQKVTRLVGRFQDVISSAGRPGARPSETSPSDGSHGLQSLLDSAFCSLTPGSQTLVLILRALVHRPALLVLDEPFQGLSASQTARVRSFLDGQTGCPSRRDLSSEERAEEQEWLDRMALMLVSHFEDEWITTAGRLIRLDEGKIVEKI